MEQENPLSGITELLKDFYRLTGVKICVYSADERELCYYPEQRTPFCALLRQDGALNEKCLACDKAAFAACKKTRQPSLSICHAGLVECFSPILYGDTTVGYIAIGQIKASESADFPALPAGLSPERLARLSECFDALPVIDREKIDAAARILGVLAGYEYLKSLVMRNEKGPAKRIADYIDAHLADDLSVDALAQEFHLSRRRIYDIFKEYFTSSVALYVKARRIDRACRLLRETDDPVFRVAEKCGFTDYNYFSKQFRGAVGTSPTDYRKNGIRRS